MKLFQTVPRDFFLSALLVGLCLSCFFGVRAAAREPSGDANVPRESLCEEEAELLVRAVAFVARGSMRSAGKGSARVAAPYAARVGIIATVLNRMEDARFPNAVVRIVASDRTFSRMAFAVEIPERDLELTRAALQDALDGFDPTNGALYFSSPETWVNRFAVTGSIGGYSFGVPTA